MVYYIIGIIFAVLSGISLVVAFFDDGRGQTNDLLVAVLFMLPACVFFIIGTLNSLYNKFINNYYRPANKYKSNVIRSNPVMSIYKEPAPPSAVNDVRIVKSNTVRSIKYSEESFDQYAKAGSYSDYKDNTDNAESSDNLVAVSNQKPQETDSDEYKELAWFIVIIVISVLVYIFVGIFLVVYTGK